jgi:dTMP kinase
MHRIAELKQRTCRRIQFSNTKMTRRGAFIVLEGCDRSGKSTQSTLLVDALTAAGIPARRVCFPGTTSFVPLTWTDRSTPIGQMINGYLAQSTEMDDRAVHLLFSANRWEAIPAIRTALLAGETVVADRYAYSGVAFSAAKVCNGNSFVLMKGFGFGVVQGVRCGTAETRLHAAG